MSQNNTLITNFPKFMINNKQKNQIELLNDLKIHLNFTINEFSNITLNSYDELIIKCKLFMDNFYSYLIKIKFYLTLLEIKDKNQTNKYEYEKCLQFTTFNNNNYISYIIQKIFEYNDNDLVINNKKIQDIAKIYNKNDDLYLQSLIITYEKNINDQINNSHNEIILQYNNIINNILLDILSVNEIIKDVNISTNNW
jgi:hypothetical protein